MWEGPLGELMSQESADVCERDIVCIAHVSVHQMTLCRLFDGQTGTAPPLSTPPLPSVPLPSPHSALPSNLSFTLENSDDL